MKPQLPVLLALCSLTLAPLPAGAQAAQVDPGEQWCRDHGIAASYRPVWDTTGSTVVGFLCAIRPSATSAVIADRNPATVADAEDLDDLACGYGAHAIAVPRDPAAADWADWSGVEGVYLHLVGTYVRPYDTGGWDETAADPLANPVAVPQDCRRCRGRWDPAAYPAEPCRDRDDPSLPSPVQDVPDPDPAGPGWDQYESLRVLIEGVQAGFLVLQPAHPNYDSNYDFCDRSDDNCAEEVRREVLLGDLAEPGSPAVSVDAGNSMRWRLRRLVEHLVSHGVILPGALGVQPWHTWGIRDWNRLRLGGHSGGSGYAYYVARNLESLISAVQAAGEPVIEHLCLLSGPFDTPDDICEGGIPCDQLEPPQEPPPFADWFLDPATSFPRHRIRALVSVHDTSIRSFRKTHQFLGLTEGLDLATMLSDLYCRGSNLQCVPGSAEHFNGHAAIVLEESLAWARTLACFAPIAGDYVPAPLLNLDMDGVCAETPPPDRADFLAANPGVVDPAQGCQAWSCEPCDYWQSLTPLAKAQTGLCLFDEVAYAAAHPPLDPASARQVYENGGARSDFADYCRDLANARRKATGF